MVFPDFSGETKPTARRLLELALSVPALDGFQSVKFNFEHFISEISDFELKSFYYALNEGKIALSDWMENLMRTALSLAPESADALILSADDTLTEKFERCGKLYDHAAHNGSHYLNGRRFVSLMLSVPLKAAGQYLRNVDEGADEAGDGRRPCPLGDGAYRDGASGYP